MIALVKSHFFEILKRADEVPIMDSPQLYDAIMYRYRCDKADKRIQKICKSHYAGFKS